MNINALNFLVRISYIDGPYEVSRVHTIVATNQTSAKKIADSMCEAYPYLFMDNDIKDVHVVAIERIG